MIYYVYSIPYIFIAIGILGIIGVIATIAATVGAKAIYFIEKAIPITFNIIVGIMIFFSVLKIIKLIKEPETSKFSLIIQSIIQSIIDIVFVSMLMFLISVLLYGSFQQMGEVMSFAGLFEEFFDFMIYLILLLILEFICSIFWAIGKGCISEIKYYSTKDFIMYIFLSFLSIFGLSMLWSDITDAKQVTENVLVLLPLVLRDIIGVNIFLANQLIDFCTSLL